MCTEIYTSYPIKDTKWKLNKPDKFIWNMYFVCWFSMNYSKFGVSKFQNFVHDLSTVEYMLSFYFGIFLNV